MLNIVYCQSNIFLRTGNCCVGSINIVDISLLAVFRYRKGLSIMMYVFQLVTQPCGVIDINNLCRSIAIGLVIKN